MSRASLVGFLCVCFATACSSSTSEDPDTGTEVDAGLPDSGTPDAGLPDAGAADAGSPGDGGTDAGLCATLPLPTPCEEPTEGALVTAVSDWGRPGAFDVTEETVANPHPVARGAVITYRPTGQDSVPVLFFSHAFGATDADLYIEMFRMLASQGYAVVFVPYPLMPAVEKPNEARYDCLWQGFLAAIEQQKGHFDLTRVGFFGHSYGGGATPEMARRGFVEQGWGGKGRFLFSMAPWYTWGHDYETLPSDVRAIVQVYADDDVNDHQIAVEGIWNHLPSNLERAWLTVPSDACGCGLNATHTLPMTRRALTNNPQNVLNAHDRQAVWRRLHALAVYSFTGSTAARGVAFGADTSLGSWTSCGGRAVRPLEVSRTQPIPAPCHPYEYPLSARCQYADPGFNCP